MKKTKLNYLMFTILVLLVSNLLNFLSMNLINTKNISACIIISTIITTFVALIILFKGFQNFNIVNEKLKETLKVRDAILELAQTAINISSEQELYDLLTTVAVDVIKAADMGSFILVNDDNTLQYKSTVYFDLQELQSVKLSLEESYIYLAGNGNVKNTVIVNNSVDFNRKHKTIGSIELMGTKGINEIKSTLSSPIIIEDKIYGMINVDSRIPYAFNEDDIKLIQFFTFEAAKLIMLYKTIAKNTYLSKYDSLTKIYNRRFFNVAVKNLMSSIQNNEVFSLISIDLNNLKVTNDTFGHDVGDKLILSFVNVINEHLTYRDIFSRYGGDEFIIVLANKSKKEALELVNKSREQMSLINLSSGNSIVSPTYSWGIVEYPIDGTDYKELIKLADQYMYQNKRNQKNHLKTPC